MALPRMARRSHLQLFSRSRGDVKQLSLDLSARAPRDVDNLPRNEGSVLASEEGNHRGDVLRLTDASDRNLLGGSDLELFKGNIQSVRRSGCHLGLNEARSDGVNRLRSHQQ